MRSITLNSTPIVTSPLGLGCVNLTMHDDPRAAVTMLESALDLGITHFDIARLYGCGQAEAILGQFLQGKRDRVTVTTKFGLEAPQALSRHRRLVSFARRMSHRFTFVKKLSGRVTGNMMRRSFTPADAAKSLETSLRELKTDYVDVFQIHEPDLASMDQPDLIEYFERQKAAGKIRAYGTGVAYSIMGPDAAAVPESLSVLQFDSDVCNANLERLANREQRGLITFSVVRRAKALAAAAAASADLRRDWQERVGVDLTHVDHVTALMLRHAVHVNPNGISLFATTRLENLRSNVRGFEAFDLTPAQIDAFAAFARAASQVTPVPAAA